MDLHLLCASFSSAQPSYGQGEPAWEVTVDTLHRITLTIQSKDCCFILTHYQLPAQNFIHAMFAHFLAPFAKFFTDTEEVFTLPEPLDTNWHHISFAVSDQNTDGSGIRSISIIVDCSEPVTREYSAVQWKDMFPGPLLYDVSVKCVRRGTIASL